MLKKKYKYDLFVSYVNWFEGYVYDTLKMVVYHCDPFGFQYIIEPSGEIKIIKPKKKLIKIFAKQYSYLDLNNEDVNELYKYFINPIFPDGE